ncbi:MAG: aminotransferase class V-fold PLP-dependent enzyme [Candidatus Aminicenantes bacterium]|nr:aminotransferase class V-fold PLP-dependent enzyme [Candidatus Aminicenantes bacterium]
MNIERNDRSLLPGRFSRADIQKAVIGRDAAFQTPYGLRHLFYADYTASGRGLTFIEQALTEIERTYANTHTEDDFTGKTMTRLVHQAEARIKKFVKAGPHDKIFAAGSGSTGALKKLQEMIGVYLPPVTRERIETMCRTVGESGLNMDEPLRRIKPVVFIGPYEHHTNELMWREAFAEVVVVGLDRRGGFDLDDLERKLDDPAHAGRIRYASFSAGSNITGVRTPVFDVARACHRSGVPVFFDFAAIAPYVEIDMNRDGESAFDAVFFSPHKFLGGPGTCGILIMKDHLYRSDLPPTTAGGGTVVYVGPKRHDYSPDIEIRETAGTPPILQLVKAALAMEVKEKIGAARIERLETGYLTRFLDRLKSIPGIRSVGPDEAGDRIPILSFNIDHGDRILHPKFVTRLLNDLFGIQSRAGCSCAGPYGHRLLGIDEATSLRYREAIVCGREGIKPGWVRINLHWVFEPADLDFLFQAIAFIAENGAEFLRDYRYKEETGEWVHRKDALERGPARDAIRAAAGARISLAKLPSLRREYLRAAAAEAEKLRLKGPVRRRDDGADAGLRYFYIAG